MVQRGAHSITIWRKPTHCRWSVHNVLDSAPLHNRHPRTYTRTYVRVYVWVVTHGGHYCTPTRCIMYTTIHKAHMYTAGTVNTHTNTLQHTEKYTTHTHTHTHTHTQYTQKAFKRLCWCVHWQTDNLTPEHIFRITILLQNVSQKWFQFKCTVVHVRKVKHANYVRIYFT